MKRNFPPSPTNFSQQHHQLQQLSQPTALPKRSRRVWHLLASFLLLPGVMLSSPSQAVLAQTTKANSPDALTYGKVLQKIDKGEVRRVEVDPVNKIARVYLKSAKTSENPQEIVLLDQNPELIDKLRTNNVEFDVQPAPSNAAALGLILNIFLVLIFVFAIAILLKRSSNASGNAMNFGKSRARFQMN
jgi:cell division protease FtsH